jgi:glycine/D-amino acid oxidase-like deaminating enzyme
MANAQKTVVVVGGGVIGTMQAVLAIKAGLIHSSSRLTT